MTLSALEVYSPKNDKNTDTKLTKISSQGHLYIKQMKIIETKMLEVFDLNIPEDQKDKDGVGQVYFTDKGVIVTNRFALVCKDYELVFEELSNEEREALKGKWISVEDYKTAVNNDLDIVDGRIIDDWGEVDIELHEARKGFVKSLYNMIDTVCDPKQKPVANFMVEAPYISKMVDILGTSYIEICTKKAGDDGAFVGLFNTDGVDYWAIGILYCRVNV